MKISWHVLIGLIIIMSLSMLVVSCEKSDSNLSQSKLLEKLIRNANNSDTKAQYRLANAYFDGPGSTIYINKKNIPNPLAKDYAKGIYWLGKAADLGDRMAKGRLCLIYGGSDLFIKGTDSYGKVLKISPAEAIRYCSNLGVGGEDQLGDMFYKLGNYGMAVKWYKKAANQGYEDAQFALGKMYLFGKGVEVNYQQGFQLIHKSVMQDVKKSDFKDGFAYDIFTSSNPETTSLLATLYERGIGTKRDHNEALHYYFLAARTAGQVANEKIYIQSLMQKSNAKNNPYLYDIIASQKFSNTYDFGQDALRKLTEFAVKKDIQAISLLGSLGFIYGKCYSGYMLGTYYPASCPVSINQFQQLLKFAAHNGNPLAQFVLGRAILFEWGKDDSPSTKKEVNSEANKWFLKAAKQGVLLAQISLCNNEWSTLDPAKIYAWCKVVLANRSKFSNEYQALTKDKSWASYEHFKKMFEWNFSKASSKFINQGEKIFIEYNSLYGGRIYELKDNKLIN